MSKVKVILSGSEVFEQINIGQRSWVKNRSNVDDFGFKKSQVTPRNFRAENFFMEPMSEYKKICRKKVWNIFAIF